VAPSMGTGSFPGVKCGRGVLLTTHLLLVPRSWKCTAISLPTLWATPGLNRDQFFLVNKIDVNLERCWNDADRKKKIPRKETFPNTTLFTTNSILLYVDTVALGQVFLHVLQFPPVGTFPPVLQCHISLIFRRRHKILALDRIILLQYCHFGPDSTAQYGEVLPVWYHSCISTVANKHFFNAAHNRI